MPAAAKALSLKEEVQEMKDAFAERRVLMHQGLSSLPGFVVPEPEGAFYILCDITGTGLTDIEFAHQALEHAQVQVIPAP